MNIREGCDLETLFWPQFVEHQGGIYLSGDVPNDKTPDPNLTQTEASYTHRHLLDFFDHGASLQAEPFWDNTHVDFIAAAALGKQIVHIWALKLKYDYPGIKFRIYYCEEDNPIIRFHKIRPEFPNWLSEEDYRTELFEGKIVIIETD